MFRFKLTGTNILIFQLKTNGLNQIIVHYRAVWCRIGLHRPVSVQPPLLPQYICIVNVRETSLWHYR